jgi:hypothetical protein
MQERDVIPQRKTLVLLVAGILMVVISAIGAQLILEWRLSELHDRDREQAPRTTPRELSGIEQVSAIENGAAKDYSEQRVQLTSYGWVDREHGIAHVPIDKAIHDYIAEERR